MKKVHAFLWLIWFIGLELGGRNGSTRFCVVGLMNRSSLLPALLTQGSYLSGHQQSLKLSALLVNQKAT
jgi:hypothetical protein